MRTIAAFCLACAIIIQPIRGFAAESPGVELNPGDVVSESGAFFPGEAAIALLEALRDLKSLRAKLDVLAAELNSKDSEIASQKDSLTSLEEARAQTAIALAKAEFIIQNWELINRAMLSVIDEHRKVNAELRALNDQTLKALKEARTELWWTKVLSVIPVIGAGIAIFAGR